MSPPLSLPLSLFFPAAVTLNHTGSNKSCALPGRLIRHEISRKVRAHRRASYIYLQNQKLASVFAHCYAFVKPACSLQPRCLRFAYYAACAVKDKGKQMINSKLIPPPAGWLGGEEDSEELPRLKNRSRARSGALTDTVNFKKGERGAGGGGGVLAES